MTGRSPTGEPLETENKIVFKQITDVIPRRCVHGPARKSSDSACTRRIILKKTIVLRTRDCKLRKRGFPEIPSEQTNLCFAWEGHSFFWPGQFVPGCCFSKKSTLRSVLQHYFQNFPSRVHGRLLYSEGAKPRELIKQHKQPNGFSKVVVLRTRHETFLPKVSCRVHEATIYEDLGFSRFRQQNGSGTLGSPAWPQPAQCPSHK